MLATSSPIALISLESEEFCLTHEELSLTIAHVTSHVLIGHGVSEAALASASENFTLNELTVTRDGHIFARQSFETVFGLDSVFAPGIALKTDANREFAYLVWLVGNEFMTDIDFSTEAVRLLRERFSA